MLTARGCAGLPGPVSTGEFLPAAAGPGDLRLAATMFGRRRVTTDLKVKGVHADVIEKAVDEAYSGVNENRQARAFLERKRLKKPQNDREAARIFRALMRAGFGMATSIAILKTWNVDDEVLTAFQEEVE